MSIVHVIDGGVGARYVYEQLSNANINCRTHSPNDNRARAAISPYPSMSVGHSEQEIEHHIGQVLGTYRGIFLISSYIGSLIANQMIDLCGQSDNIITCDNLGCGPVPVAAAQLSVNVYKKQRQLARIHRRLKHFDTDSEFLVADHAIRFAAGNEFYEDEAREELGSGPKFLSSPSLIVAAQKLGVKRNTYHNYAGLVQEFIAKRQ